MSPSSTRIIEGGIIWPSVPDAAIVPVDISDFMCMEIDFIDDLNIVNERLDSVSK